MENICEYIHPRAYFSTFPKLTTGRKMKKHTFLSLLLGFLLFVVGFKSHAETYHGDYCWQVLKNDVPAWVYRFGVYEKEGGHYALYGREDNGLGDITAAHGNATLVESNIKMTIIGSGFTEQFGVWSETLNAILDSATLSGSWHALGVSYNNNGVPSQYYANGNINLITCP